MSSLLGKKIWRANDVVRVVNNVKVVQVFKFHHPYRCQEITIIPTPRYATKGFYDNWVYQPYAQEHCLCFSNNLYVSQHVALSRLLFCFDKSKQWLLRTKGNTQHVIVQNSDNASEQITKNSYNADDNNNSVDDSAEMYECFSLSKIPDNIDLNLTRHEFMKRMKLLKCSAWVVMFTTTPWRDKHEFRMEQKIVKLLEYDVLAPVRPESESTVFLLQPDYVVIVLNTLTKLGYVLSNSAYAEVGNAAVLQRLHNVSMGGEYIFLFYVWMLTAIVIFDVLKRINNLHKEFLRAKAEEATRLALNSEKIYSG